MRYAAWLHRKLKTPIFVSGGKPGGGILSEAEVMRRVLEDEFSLPVKWIEEKSNNTYEQAINVRETLSKEGIDIIYLITHRTHMARAQSFFEKVGFQVIPAPTGFHRTGTGLSLKNILPAAGGLKASSAYMREKISQFYYGLRLALKGEG